MKSRSMVDSLARACSRAVVIVTAAFLMSPILIIIPMSFDTDRYLDFPPSGFTFYWYRVFFTSFDWRSAFVNSVEVALIATTLSLALGIPAAFALVRSKASFKPLLISVLSLPLIFPIIASAVAVYYVFAKLHLVGTILGLALAHTILALPIVILPTAAALQQFEYRIEWQAINLGASEWQVLRTITLPLLRPVVFIVMLFAFVTSFDEVVFAIFLSGGEVVTLPKKVWEGLRFEIDPTVAVVATLLLVGSFAIVAATALLQRRAVLPMMKPRKYAP